MATSLTTEIIRDGRLDISLNARERFRWEFEIQNDDGSAVNLAGSTVELFIKPLDLSLEPRTALTAAVDDTETGPINTEAIPVTFPEKGFVKIDNEVIRYDSRTSSQLDTLTRAEDEASVAANHADEAVVILAGRIVDEDGPTNEKLIIDEASGKVTAYISQPTLDKFMWLKAEYRLQMIDAAGDPESLASGYMIFEKRWAQ